MLYEPIHIFVGILGSLSTNVIVSAVTHRLTINREARDRKSDFREFLGGWLIDIQRVTGGETGKTYDVYIDKVRNFGGYAARLDRDFFRRRKFKKMCRSLSTLEPKHITNEHGDCRDIVTKKIEALIEFSY